MILVTGANGHFGKATIDFLLQKGVPPASIAGLVREQAKGSDLKAKGVGVKIGDYSNYQSLVDAFGGVDKLLVVSGTDLGNRSAQHENAIKAAKQAGVKHILYTSVALNQERENTPLGLLGQTHLYTEKVIKESGIAYTILRNNMYLDFLPMFLGEKVLETGVFFPAGEGKVAFALRGEMAEAAANVLTGQGHENKVYHVSNSQAVSFGEIAAILSSLTGRQVPYLNPSTAAYIDALAGAGVPKESAAVFAGIGEAIKQGELAPPTAHLETLLGRKPASVKEFLIQGYGSKQ